MVPRWLGRKNLVQARQVADGGQAFIFLSSPEGSLTPWKKSTLTRTAPEDDAIGTAGASHGHVTTEFGRPGRVPDASGRPCDTCGWSYLSGRVRGMRRRGEAAVFLARALPGALSHVIRRLTLTTGCGIFAILAFLSLGAVSYTRYPAAFSVTKNWLSDLGNVTLNPRGAAICRVDVILVGLVIGLFFVGLAVRRNRQRSRTKVFISCSQAVGLVSGQALRMTGEFSVGLYPSHAIWACIFFISSGAAVFLSGLGFLHYRRPFKKLTYLAFSLAVLEWAMAAVSRIHVIEWVVIALLLLYFASVAVGTSTLAARSAAMA